MATNRWYDNTTNIIIDFTPAEASDVENKLTDVANGLDALEAEFDAEVTRAIKVLDGVTTPDLVIVDGVAVRQDKLLGFDEFGNITLYTPTIVGTVLDTYTVVTDATTLAVNNLYYITSGAGYTITLPATPVAGYFIALHFDGYVEDDNITLDGNGENIEGYASLVIDVNFAELHLVYNGSEWRI